MDSAVNALRDGVLHELIQENRRLHRLMVDGVPVSYERGGETIHDRLRLVDWSNAENDWLAVNQFTVVGSSNRRPDIVIFLNGLPVVVIELKAPESANADIRSAYNQLQTYKHDIPALFSLKPSLCGLGWLLSTLRHDLCGLRPVHDMAHGGW